MTTMKAAIYRQYGPPQVVSVQEVPVPQISEHEVLVRVLASTVNRTDTGFRSAEYVISRLFSGLWRPKFQVLGCEFCGEITAVGTSVTRFKVGQVVVGFNDAYFGGHAEYMKLPESAAMVEKPTNIDPHLAAAITEGGHYALCDLRAAKVKAGDRVLINGGTGSIGSAAIQLAKVMGLYVVAVCATEHIDKVKSLGADRVIDYTQEDFTKCGESFDLVFDAVGKSSFGQCNKIMKEQALYVSTELGPYWQNVFLAIAGKWKKGKRVIFPLPTTDIRDIQYLCDLVEQGKYKPLYDRTYTLDQIVAAHEYVGSGMKTGNVVIAIW